MNPLYQLKQRGRCLVDHVTSPLTTLALEPQLRRGLAALLTGSVAARLVAVVASVLVARQLGLISFGEYGAVQGTLAMFQALAGFGLGETAMKYVAEFRVAQPDRAGRIAGLSYAVAAAAGFLFMGVTLLAAPTIAGQALNAPQLTPVLRIAAPSLLLLAINGAQLGILAGLEAFIMIAKVQFAGAVCTFCFVLGGAALGGLSGVAWGLVGAAFVTAFACQISVGSATKTAGVHVAFRGAASEAPLLLAFSLPALIGSLMVVPVSWFCMSLLIKAPGGLAQMGLYNAANQWFQVLLFVPGILGQAILPLLSSRIGRGDHGGAVHVMRASMIGAGLFSLPLVVMLCIASPLLMTIYGREFADGWATLAVSAITGALLAIQAPVGHYLVASGRMWTGCAMNAAWGLIFVGATVSLAGYGSLGVATARLIAYTAHGVWTVWYAFTVLRPRRLVPVEARV